MSTDLLPSKDFIPKLNAHILQRLGYEPSNGVSFTLQERVEVDLKDGRLYFHSFMRVNYTSYDRRRQQDLLNPSLKSDIMMLADETDRLAHPYYYARVIGIFHVVARCHTGPQKYQSLNVLWIRWLALDEKEKGGFKDRRLYQVGYAAGTDDEAFGFVDPDSVIRGVHLMPNYVRGLAGNFLPSSVARRSEEVDMDWFRYYVNMYVNSTPRVLSLMPFRFVDRDMFHRFTGNGIGHRATYSATKIFRDDCNAAYGRWIPGEENTVADDVVEQELVSDEEDSDQWASDDEDADDPDGAGYGYNDEEDEGESEKEDSEQDSEAEEDLEVDIDTDRLGYGQP